MAGAVLIAIAAFFLVRRSQKPEGGPAELLADTRQPMTQGRAELMTDPKKEPVEAAELMSSEQAEAKPIIPPEELSRPPVELPAEQLPVETPPVEAQPIEAQPIEAQPTEAQPTTIQPSETLPAEAPPLSETKKPNE